MLVWGAGSLPAKGRRLRRLSSGSLQVGGGSARRSRVVRFAKNAYGKELSQNHKNNVKVVRNGGHLCV